MFFTFFTKGYTFNLGLKERAMRMLKTMRAVVLPQLVLLTVSAQRPAGAAKDSRYRLAWSDEFNKPTLDEAKWVYRTDSKYLSRQLPANVSLQGGFLRIALRGKAGNEQQYTGGGVISKQMFGYGFYEARIRIAAGNGWHSSFWMQGYNGVDTKTQKATVELDALENQSQDMHSYGVNTHRWLGEHMTKGHKMVSTPDLAAGFHTFGCEYQPDRITYFFDGEPVQSVDWTGEPQGQENIWLTSIAEAMGPKHDVDESVLPGTMYVDWVRFYTRK